MSRWFWYFSILYLLVQFWFDPEHRSEKAKKICILAIEIHILGAEVHNLSKYNHTFRYLSADSAFSPWRSFTKILCCFLNSVCNTFYRFFAVEVHILTIEVHILTIEVHSLTAPFRIYHRYIDFFRILNANFIFLKCIILVVL